MSEIVSGTVTLTAIVLALTLLILGAKAALQPTTILSISIGDRETITGIAGQTLLSALSDAGIKLPSTCGGRGTCGLCRITVREGGGQVLPPEQALLTRKEIRDRLRLACQVVMRSPLSVELPASMRDAVTVTGTIASVRQLSSLIREVVIDLPPDGGLSPEAGAFVEVEIPPYELSFARMAVPENAKDAWQRMGLMRLNVTNSVPVVRAYSLANRPQDKDKIVLNIRLAVPPPNRDVPPGIASSYLFSLTAGENIVARGPFGNFRVQDSDREMIFIGGGVGMAPLRAMIFDELERKGTRRKISYWYGARSCADLFYSEEFEDLAKRFDNFRWTVALSEPEKDGGWIGPTGFIHIIVRESYLAHHPAPEDCEYYLCGPPMMIRSVRLMLQELGVSSDDVFFDDFGS